MTEKMSWPIWDFRWQLMLPLWSFQMCSVDRYQPLGGTCCFHFQDRKWRQQALTKNWYPSTKLHSGHIPEGHSLNISAFKEANKNRSKVYFC